MSETIIAQLQRLLERRSLSSQVGVAVTAAVAIYGLKRAFTKSPLAHISGPPSPSYLTGHLSLLLAYDAVDFLTSISEKYGGVVKLYGPLGEEMLYISDPMALHFVMKDLDLWPESPFVISMSNLIFGPGILSSHGAAHRRQRKMLLPIFTVPYLRELTPTFYAVTYQLREAMMLEMKQSREATSVDMISWLSRIALELIGQGGLGHSFGALGGESDVFSKAAKDLVPALTSLRLVMPFLPILTKIGSASFRRRVVQAIPSHNVKRMAQVVDDMDHTASEVFNRKKEILSGEVAESTEGLVGEGKDLLTGLLKANAEAVEEDRLPDEELKAQLATLLFAASDTTSGALGRILHVLSSHVAEQNKLRAEITEARKSHNGEDLDFHDIDSLPYLDAVVRETLRVFAPVATMSRNATCDAVIPLHYPLTGADGKTQITSITAPKGTMVHIAITSANRSTKIWGPDAAEWSPERWLKPLPTSVAEAKVPSIFASLLTFLNGGKSCIGYRFALLEMKIVLFVLLESFKFTADVEIEWHAGLTMTPHIVGDNKEIRLPLRVEPVGTV